MPGPRKTRAHVHPVALSKPLYLAMQKLCADLEISWSDGHLYAITEGLHSLGYLSPEAYQFYRDRYSQPLLDKYPEDLAEIYPKPAEVMERPGQTDVGTPTQTSEKDQRVALEHVATWIQNRAKRLDKLTREEIQQTVDMANKYPLAPGSREILEQIKKQRT